MVVLGVTAGLVNAAPARVSYTKPVDVTVPGVDGGRVQVRVDPAKQGQNVADIYLVAARRQALRPARDRGAAARRQEHDRCRSTSPTPSPATTSRPRSPSRRPGSGRCASWSGPRRSTSRRSTSRCRSDEARCCVARVLLALAAAASAHVTVLPRRRPPGRHRASSPSASRTNATTPPPPPSSSSSRRASRPRSPTHPGWTAEDKGNGEIAWTPDTPAPPSPPAARRTSRSPLGPLPQSDRIVFKALQTYADGQIVRWIQDSGPDDERPAAILDLSGNGGSDDRQAAAPS